MKTSFVISNSFLPKRSSSLQFELQKIWIIRSPYNVSCLSSSVYYYSSTFIKKINNVEIY